MVARDRKAGKFILKLGAPVLVIGAFVLGYFLGGNNGQSPVVSVPTESQDHARKGEQSDIADVIWTCSMHPQIRLPDPGKCPICFMDLIPVKRDSDTGKLEAVSLRQVKLTPQALKLAEVVVEPVVRHSVGVETRMVGKVDYDERRLGYITTWMEGRIDKLFVDYTGSVVRKGQPMASIYSPELLTAQAELIQAVKAIREFEKSDMKRVKETARQTEQAAREKLRLLGLGNEQIEAVIRDGTPSDHITLHAPMSGIVIQKDVVEGMYVKTGTRIYAIADLSRVWVILEAYESDLPWIKLGQQVEFQTEAYPGKTFTGKTVYIDPVVNEKTRTIRVRLEVPNPSAALKPGMFVRAVKRTSTEGEKEPLVIPDSAPLITGKRAIVYVQVPEREGVYEGREIVLGPKAGQYYIVKTGLSEGELVVTKGNFKIDSAVQLQARPSMMNPQGAVSATGHVHDQSAPLSVSSAKPSHQIPAPMVHGLRELMKGYDAVNVALENRNLEDIRGAYKNFYNILCSIDPSSLAGQAALVWKEFAMLLRNDSYLGSESDTPEEAARLFVTMTEHFQGLREEFDFDKALQEKETSTTAPLKFKQGLGEALRVYLDLQDALARDDFQSAKTISEKLGASISALDTASLEGETQTTWMKAFGLLDKALKEISSPQDIAAIRGGFASLSQGMVEAVSRLGVEINGPLFEFFCSMAFNDKGASWIQQDEDIRNPYYGAEMLKCGEVKGRIKGD